MNLQLRRTIQAGFLAALGGLSVVAIWPLLAAVADPSMCLGLTPEQSWISLHLHLVVASAACAQGGYVATSMLAPMVGVTLAVSVSALAVGLATIIVGLGGEVAVRTLLRRVRAWMRRRWLPVIHDVMRPARPVPARVRAQGYRGRADYRPAQRRGPPSACAR